MKILTIAPTSFFSDRGSHMRIYNEVEYLQKLGHQELVFCYGLGNDIVGIKLVRIGKNSWYTKTHPGFSWGKIWLDLEMVFKGVKLIREYQPDIIHAHLFEGLGVAWLIKRLTKLWFGLRGKKIPIVLDLQGDLSNEFESYNQEKTIAKKIFVKFSYWLIKRADKVVASSKRSAEKIKQRYNFDPVVIKDGINLDLFTKQKMKKRAVELELKDIKKWRGDDRVLIYTGGMDRSKGVDKLLQVFNTQKLKNWKLLMFGNGKEKVFFKKKYAGNKKIYFCQEFGYFFLPNYLKLAQVAIDPKEDSTESSGKLVNYMAGKLPIICFGNKFNRQRLGKRGNYLTTWSDLKQILETIDLKKVVYNLEQESEKQSVEKLVRIMEALLKD